ncbi:hypothetical protein B5F76_05865 [Desulfovibrio sp. An276]|uniref:hypothetical protein n=1 Tax=Desulfovibrio sp. An276 TaxID=1965618 RepID=UPI000B37AA9E|nr:hypothetical protein [Desulfovibrio sp. An276]OUO53303.1 hypothetical protein B5F76_05865 [Desulfovibrio sp. An276]
MPTATPWLVRVLDSNWRDDTNYAAGDLKFHNEKYWKALQPSGPDKGGAKEPGVDAGAWEEHGGGGFDAGSGISISDGTIKVDSSVVRTTGIQNIGGEKMFTDYVTIQTGEKGATDERTVSEVLRTYYDSAINAHIYHAYTQSTPYTKHEMFLGVGPFASDSNTAEGNQFFLGIHTDGYSKNYVTAPSTRDNPIDTEVVTVDYLKKFTASQLPLYFTADSLELHTFVPANAKTVRYAALEADGSGTSGLTLTMARDIGSSDSVAVASTATNCTAYANHSVTFTLGGVSDQTEIAAMVVFE